jgi:O-antigen ligase
MGFIDQPITVTVPLWVLLLTGPYLVAAIGVHVRAMVAHLSTRRDGRSRG